MEPALLHDFYIKHSLTEDAAAAAVSSLKTFQDFSGKGGASIEDCSESGMKDYISYCSEQKPLDENAIAALARAAYLGQNYNLYRFLLQIAERGGIIKNIREHMETVLGAERVEQIFEGVRVPEEAELPERAWLFTEQLVSRLKEAASPDECRRALQGNAHGIPAEAFAKEAEFLRNAGNLESYLADVHRRSVQTLQRHADSGEIWFEQLITQPVVDWVAANPEVLGGVLEGSVIYWTKIPYDPDAWLKEKDPEKKRYLACHCPMAREVLNFGDSAVPGLWCNCTAGFVKQRFNAIFGRETEVELLESVLDGAERCRFAIHVP